MRNPIMLCVATLFGISIGIAGASAFFVRSTEVQAVLITGFAAIAVSVVATGSAIWAMIENGSNGRIKATLDYLSHKEGDADFEAARKIFINLSQQGGQMATWAALDQQATDEATAIRVYLNAFEFQAMAVDAGAFDARIYSQWQRGTLLSIWRHASAYVSTLRANTGRSSLYENIEKLAKRYGA